MALQAVQKLGKPFHVMYIIRFRGLSRIYEEINKPAREIKDFSRIIIVFFKR